MSLFVSLFDDGELRGRSTALTMASLKGYVGLVRGLLAGGADEGKGGNICIQPYFIIYKPFFSLAKFIFIPSASSLIKRCFLLTCSSDGTGSGIFCSSLSSCDEVGVS